MSRIHTAVPLVPQSEQTPHYHPPGARCLDCRYWPRDGHPNLRKCRMFNEDRDRDWSCILFKKSAPGGSGYYKGEDR